MREKLNNLHAVSGGVDFTPAKNGYLVKLDNGKYLAPNGQEISKRQAHKLKELQYPSQNTAMRAYSHYVLRGANGFIGDNYAEYTDMRDDNLIDHANRVLGNR